MKHKRVEITEFLDKDLLYQISNTLEESSGQDQQTLAKKLIQKKATLREMGIDPIRINGFIGLRHIIFVGEYAEMASVTY